MSLIDWSDPDEMLGLLVEYVADEAATSHDSGRTHFLNELSRELGALAADEFETADQIELALLEIRDAQPIEFASDPVMDHLEACIEELRRIETVHRHEARR